MKSRSELMEMLDLLFDAKPLKKKGGKTAKQPKKRKPPVMVGADESYRKTRQCRPRQKFNRWFSRNRFRKVKRSKK